MLSNLYIVCFLIGGMALVWPLIGDAFDNSGSYAPPKPSGVFSIYGATAFLLSIGIVGTALTKFTLLRPDYIAVITVAAAIVGTLVLTRLLKYLNHSADNRVEHQRSLHGLVAEVIVPIGPVHGGKIVAQRGAQRIQMLARPFHSDSGDAAAWREVMIVDVRDGIALVSPVSPAHVPLQSPIL